MRRARPRTTIHTLLAGPFLLFAAFLAAPARAEPPVASAPPDAPPASVTVHVHTLDSRMKLYSEPLRPDAQAGPIQPSLLCSSACGLPIEADPAKRFFFDAPGMPSSRRFRLDDRSGDVDVLVAPGNTYRFGMGIGMIISGAGEIVAGAISGGLYPDKVVSRTVPFVVLGTTVAAVGIVLTYAGSTRVTFLRGKRANTDVARRIGAALLNGVTF